ncbi:uncharacterized protein LOC113502778 [Trichoplusia ni]|uniref:Uncharacterized protein LOC113502778 n=1 Tax=Trichoplusia ni TaxID=7111 RepID=A0A7E5WHN7_TRINI|nr:uncharacterized protein LOC113502778 [Trichoplusia ni]
MSFKNKVVLITGASAGIGAVTAVEFAKEGANVAIVGRNEAKLKEVAQQCEKLGVKVLPIKADVSKENEAGTIVKKTVDKFGKLDVLVNNAGILKTVPISAPEVLSTYDEIMNTNLRAVIQLTNLAAPYLEKTKGNIINISSGASKTFIQNSAITIYGLSKAALDHFSKGSALELGPKGVRVNIVSPGPVRTDMMDANGGEENKSITVLDRVSEPEEVADVIMFLASDKAKGVTGAYYSVDNGVTIKF